MKVKELISLLSQYPERYQDMEVFTGSDLGLGEVTKTAIITVIDRPFMKGRKYADYANISDDLEETRQALLLE